MKEPFLPTMSLHLSDLGEGGETHTLIFFYRYNLTLPALIFRICPGRYFAADNVWFVVSSMLSVFNIAKAKDNEGNEIEVTPEYTDTALRYVFLSKVPMKL